MTVRRYSKRTVGTYLYWISAIAPASPKSAYWWCSTTYIHVGEYFIIFHKKRHPSDTSGPEVVQFLTHLAVERKVAAATQGIALNSLAFLYNKFLDKPLGDLSSFRRASRQRKLPVVLSRLEINNLLSQLSSTSLLIASMLHGSGLRRIEAVRLRVNDIDFGHIQVRIWNGKGFKHRLTTLAPELVPILRHQIQKVTLQLK